MRQEQIEIPVSLFLYEFIVFYKKYIIKSLLIIKNSIKITKTIQNAIVLYIDCIKLLKMMK